MTYNGESSEEFYSIASPEDLGRLAHDSDEDTYSCSDCGSRWPESALYEEITRDDDSWVCAGCLEARENEREAIEALVDDVIEYIPSFKSKRTQGGPDNE